MRIEEPKFQQLAAGSTTRLDLWTRILGAANYKTILEIGVWKGDFAEHVLKQCEFIKKYYMIDPWANLPDWNKPFNVSMKLFDEIYGEAMARTAFAASKRIVLRGKTKEVISQIPDDSVDFAYIDGDHTLRGIAIDLIRVLPKISEGGLIGGDDFTETPWHHDVRFEPTLVCPFSAYFAEAMDLPIVVLPFNQFVLQKSHNSSFKFIDTTGEYSDLSLSKLTSAVRGSRITRKLKHLLSKLGFA